MHNSNRWFRPAALAAVVAAGTMLGGCMWPRSAKPEVAYAAPEQISPRVGQVDRVDLLVAFHKSKVHDDRLRAMIKERDEARVRGDNARVRELEREGKAMQDRAHRQLAGRAPLTNIIDAIRDKLPEVAREQRVDRIDVVQKVKPSESSPDITKPVTALLPPAK